jgi:hypothetical protein
MRRLRGRQKRTGLLVPTALLSSSIMTLALIVWFANSFSVSIFTDCSYAAYWMSGWNTFTSLFQMTGAVIGLMCALWFASHFACGSPDGRVEPLLQGVILVTLAFWLIATKSFLLPHGWPRLTQVAEIVNAAFPRHALLEEEPSPIAGYDDARRPEVEFDRHPMSYPEINKRLGEIFTSRFSPTGDEMNRLGDCVVEQRRAFDQYKEDQAILREFEKEVLLSTPPKRPRDWREDVTEKQASVQGAD